MAFEFNSSDSHIWMQDTFSSITQYGPFSLLTCWFRPTTLTAGRVIFSLAHTTYVATEDPSSLQIAATTSELEFSNSRSIGTPWVQSSTDAGLVTGQWYFVAVGYSFTANRKIVVWLGDAFNTPRELTLTATSAGAGPEHLSNRIYVGNEARPTPARPFQGQIAAMTSHHFSKEDSLGRMWLLDYGIYYDDPFTAPALGKQRMLECYVQPLWAGQVPQYEGAMQPANSSLEALFFAPTLGAPLLAQAHSSLLAGNLSTIAATYNNVTQSEHRHPRADFVTARQQVSRYQRRR